jgi:hypothetical protein
MDKRGEYGSHVRILGGTRSGGGAAFRYNTAAFGKNTVLGGPPCVRMLVASS